MPSFPACIIKICLIPTYVSIATSWLLANQRQTWKQSSLARMRAFSTTLYCILMSCVSWNWLSWGGNFSTRAFDNIPYIGRLEVTELVQHFTQKYKKKKLSRSLRLWKILGAVISKYFHFFSLYSDNSENIYFKTVTNCGYPGFLQK